MRATGSTTNYKLPQFEENDIPSWLTDFNSAMEKIDAAIHNAADSSGGITATQYSKLKVVPISTLD